LVVFIFLEKLNWFGLQLARFLMPAFEGRKAKVLTSQRFKFSTVRSYPMGTNAKHGTYLGTSLVGFTSLVAGLYNGGGLGIVFAIAGAALLLVSAAGFYKTKAA
jgi:hypothetical protein